MQTIRSLLLVLVTALTIGAMTASATATTIHPLFLTQSGQTLSFTGIGGLFELRALNVGVLGTVDCEKSTTSGEILNESTLVGKIELELKGKCLQVVGSSTSKCTEPIKLALSVGELGLISSTDKKVVLFVAPESGTQFAEITCGGLTTKIQGAIVGEFPESNYNVNRKGFELVFRAENKSETQANREILLLGTQMTGVELKVEGFFGGKASEETTQTWMLDGEGSIDAGPKVSILHPLFLTKSGKNVGFTGGVTSLFPPASILRALSLGGLGSVECDKSTSSGEIINESTLARKVELELSLECVATLGSTVEKCKEPIKLKLMTGELGLLSSTNKTAVFLLRPESGTELATIECGVTTTVIEGAVVGEFPENGHQYNEERTEFEFVLQSKEKTESQKITEILLSETQMMEIGLKAVGFFGGSASEELTKKLKTSEEVLISTAPKPPTFHPLFLTQSSKTLSFTSAAGLFLLRGETVGLEAVISCEQSLSSGEILNKSTLARKIELQLHGKCLQVKTGGGKENCNEPIVFKLVLGELGLLSAANHRVVVSLTPESGSEFVTVECGSEKATTTISKAVVGDFPEINEHLENQYNKDRKNFELIFQSNKTRTQAIREILLLSKQMLGVELQTSGTLGGKASEEVLETLAVDGETSIDTQ